MPDYSAFLAHAKALYPSLEITQNEPMRLHSSFKIGGEARLFARPKTTGELRFLLLAAGERDIRVAVVGCGSNILFSDSPIDALIIQTTAMSEISSEGRLITALAGAPLPAVAVYARKTALSGFEFAQGIPGSVGGGVTMNAGAYGFDISMICKSVSCINQTTLEDEELSAKQLMFGYRKSVFLSRPELIIASAVFELEEGDPAQIQAAMDDYAKRRAASQPLDYPNAGSVFKRPEGYFAGKLIDDCGLKGLTVGGACVSPKHAGFIVNVGGATCSDVCGLIEKIQEKVYCQFGLELECEIKRID